MSLASKLGIDKNKLLDKGGPVWEGPEGTGPQGGVSQSVLGKFLACRERYRILTVEGLGPIEGFSPPMEYGSMWHVAEEHFRKGGGRVWANKVREHCEGLQKKYPMDAEKVAHWYQMCLAQFPEYVEFWKNEDRDRKVLFSEQVFDVPYRLPWSGRTIRLRGKWDGASLYPEEKERPGGFYLDENKTKSQIDQTKITRQLKFDLQTMLYLVAMHTDRYGNFLNELIPKGCVIQGVRYNVVRRSAHKSPDSMLKKMSEDIADGRGGEWFGRWWVPISSHDVEVFRRTCLDPILEWLCVWWDYVAGKGMTALGPGMLNHIVNYRHPYGAYNVMDEGGTSEYDHYIESGSRVGLRNVTNLFSELQES